jgi:tRNA (cmo5U34)-methyltransferase
MSHFNRDASRTYDEKNSRLSPIVQNLHFLTGLILKGLPTRSRILCVGVGTGAEILSLAKEYPEWSFVGVDPSAAMLEVCKERLEQLGVSGRCELVHGYIQDVPSEGFDAILCVLVGHFVGRDERSGFYGEMHKRLKEDGYLINAEISFDLDSDSFPSMLEHWRRIQALMGATQESLASLPQALRDMLTVLRPQDVEQFMKASGFVLPTRFFQSFMITGWYAKKG